ncbi:TonB-dependent siderophore receptor [Sphingosinicella sp. BN140058]|uniref:TonB-dependent siderophore receptor n=1 Tax=Sphingosinicella sp. BN140058 TaxID=1892855 RepID=UPI001011B701|nr:TonB-dependent siderophore receptor [Sphingosinicella sp. BN140058]QAY76732.1 TonB-dependent siderophore receptor [Sphingosinicella sp. BN140058]
MRLASCLLLSCAAFNGAPALAAAASDEVVAAGDAAAAAAAESEAGAPDEIVVTGERDARRVLSKSDTPPLETPQPITVVTDDVFLAQGAVSVSDTLNYVAGATANPYGPDSRVDGVKVRGLDALQFRDGMRDVFSYYASIRADPYTFSQVELVRGPASALFGAGALGGLFNLSSKLPQFEAGGEIALRYGSFDRKEVLADLTGPITDELAGRIVARVRDSGTQTDHVADDRVLIAPSLTFAPSSDTSLTLLGLYQEDDGGSTAQFLPLVGTLLPNPNGKLDRDLFIGKPGWDRYDGRLLQGTAILDHRFSDQVRLSLKARYIDSDLDYFTHYPDSYSNPAAPYLDADQRIIGLYADANRARMEIFSTDNNLRVTFDTGAQIEHALLAGVDYSWNHVRKVAGFGYESIDIYDPDYASLSDYGGGLPEPSAPSEDIRQTQLGFYLQDQIRIADRVSVTLGVRHDQAEAKDALGGGSYDESATTFRAGVIGEIVAGVSPFVSYTESFEPIAGAASDGSPFKPKSGRQYEAGIKFQPAPNALVTVTAFHIKESNTPIDDAGTPDPFDQIQAGSLTSKGFEIEGRATLPGDLQLIANVSRNDAKLKDTGRQLENVPKTNASLWALKQATLASGMTLRIGGGVRYVGANRSFGAAFPDGIRTPSYTLVDAVAEIGWKQWSLGINAVNLFDKRFYSACLARGDCFQGQARNVFGTLSYRF